MDLKRACSFCELDKNAKYSCPKCGQFYCSLNCYKSVKHLNCSELFYRKCVQDELRCQESESNDEVKQRTLEIIKRDYQNLIEDEQELDEQEEFDKLKVQFNKMHIQNENYLWSKLNEQEQNQFNKLLKQNEITNLLPIDFYLPWYLKIKKSNYLIEEIDSKQDEELNKEVNEYELKRSRFIKELEVKLNEANFRKPEIRLPIKSLIDLTKVKSSPFIKCILINILFSYCFMCRHFNNDHLTFANESYRLLDEISLLNRKVLFKSTRESIQFTIQLLINKKSIKTDYILVLIDDLKFILSNQNRIYLNIISDLIELTKLFKKERKKSKSSKNVLEDLNEKDVKNSEPLNANLKDKKSIDELKKLTALLKRLEYYLSYLNENQDLIEQISEIDLERLYLLDLKRSIETDLNDKKGEIKIY